MAHVPAEIRTEHFPNASQKRYRFREFVRLKNTQCSVLQFQGLKPSKNRPLLDATRLT
jgi:hypothetical protein